MAGVWFWVIEWGQTANAFNAGSVDLEFSSQPTVYAFASLERIGFTVVAGTGGLADMAYDAKCNILSYRTADGVTHTPVNGAISDNNVEAVSFYWSLFNALTNAGGQATTRLVFSVLGFE